MQKKYIIIGVVILAIAAGLYFYMNSKKIEPTAKQIADLEKHILEKNPEWKAGIESRATSSGVPFAKRLRQEVLSSLRESLNR